MVKTKHMRSLTFILICLSIVGCNSQPRSEYLMVRARIDGHSSRLVLDTGSTNLALHRQAAKRLHLEASNPSKDQRISLGKVAIGYSEKCRFSCPYMDFDEDVIFGIFDSPPGVGSFSFDGMIGWENLRCNIIYLNTDEKILEGLAELPEDIDSWSKWPIYEYPEINVLLITVPDAEGKDGSILIDTGAPDGISLNAQRWSELKDSQEGQPYTLGASYTPAVGWRVYEVRRADTLDIGGLTLSDVPVRLSDEVSEQAFPNYQATLGLFALSRLEVIVDGPGGFVYTRPKQNPRSVYDYNRAGTVFARKDGMDSPLMAHVAENGPAYQAGLRSGDVLIKVSGLFVLKRWKSQFALLPFHKRQKVGSKVKLSVMRDDKPVSVTLKLADIFPQDNKDGDSNKRHRYSVENEFDSKPIVFCEDSNVWARIQRDREAAKQGDPKAQYHLGEAYCIGMGLPQDYSEAAKWWHAAAEQGNADSKCRLGILYRNGFGVEIDETKAITFFTEAALQGVAAAQYHLGESYLTGRGVDQDYKEAAKWLDMAARQGIAYAQYDLGNMYLKGHGVERNYRKAFELFTQAAEQGIAQAQTNLGFMYLNGWGIEKDYPKAFELFTLAANQGIAEAQNSLGVMYLNGLGVEQDYTKAIEFFTLVAERGNAPASANAQANLSLMYMNGYGVDRSYVEAYKWALIAGKNGNYNSQLIEHLDSIMTSKQMAEGRRLANEYLGQYQKKE